MPFCEHCIMGKDYQEKIECKLMTLAVAHTQKFIITSVYIYIYAIINSLCNGMQVSSYCVFNIVCKLTIIILTSILSVCTQLLIC